MNEKFKKKYLKYKKKYLRLQGGMEDGSLASTEYGSHPSNASRGQSPNWIEIGRVMVRNGSDNESDGSDKEWEAEVIPDGVNSGKAKTRRQLKRELSEKKTPYSKEKNSPNNKSFVSSDNSTNTDGSYVLSMNTQARYLQELADDEDYSEEEEDIEFGGINRPQRPNQNPDDDSENERRMWDLISLIYLDETFKGMKRVGEKKIRIEQISQTIYEFPDIHAQSPEVGILLKKGNYRLGILDVGEDSTVYFEKMRNISAHINELKQQLEMVTTEIEQLTIQVTQWKFQPPTDEMDKKILELNTQIELHNIEKDSLTTQIESMEEVSPHEYYTTEGVRFEPDWSDRLLHINQSNLAQLQDLTNRAKKYSYYPVKEISRLYKHMIDANEITRPKICPKSDKTMACWLKRYVEKPKNEKKIPRIGANMSNDYEVCELVCAVYFAGKTAQHLYGYNFDTKLENLLSADADVFDKFRPLTRDLIDQQVLDCGGNEENYLIDGINGQKMDRVKIHFGKLKEKAAPPARAFDTFIDRIELVVLSGKTITNKTIKALIDSELISSDAKNEKSDVHILLRDPLIDEDSPKLVGFSVKQTQEATEVNYSLEKILNDINSKLGILLKQLRENTIRKWLSEVQEAAKKKGLIVENSGRGPGLVRLKGAQLFQREGDAGIVWTIPKMKGSLTEWIKTWNAHFGKDSRADDGKPRVLCSVNEDTKQFEGNIEFFTYEFFNDIFNSSDSDKKDLLRDIMKHCWYKERHDWPVGEKDWAGSPDPEELSLLDSTPLNPDTYHYYHILKALVRDYKKDIGQTIADSLFGVHTQYPFWKINGETCELLNNKKVSGFELKSDSTKYKNNAKLFFTLSIKIVDRDNNSINNKKYSLEVRFKGDQGFKGSPQFQSKEIPWD